MVCFPPSLARVLVSAFVNVPAVSLVLSDGAAVGSPREDGQKASRRSSQQDRQVPLPGQRQPHPDPEVVQERQGVQERPPHRRLQGDRRSTPPR